MYFDLEELEISNIKKEGKHFTFEYNGKKYHYKATQNILNYYNEIVAKKIADRLNIPCCKYYLASTEDSIGNVSEYFSTNNNFKTMSELLTEFYKTNKNKNNLKSIRILLFAKYDSKTAEELYEQLENIFIFDCLIGNCDRNSNNYGLMIINGKIYFLIYDNENMLSDYGIYDGEYSLGIDEFDTDTDNYLYKYLDSNPKARDKVQEMLQVISDETLNDIFTELENEYDINQDIKMKLLEHLSINRNMILNYFKEIKRR